MLMMTKIAPEARENVQIISVSWRGGRGGSGKTCVRWSRLRDAATSTIINFRYQNNKNTYRHHHHHHTCASPAVDGADANAARCATHLKLGEESVPVEELVSGVWCD
jgi:hypothetical protein